MDHNDALAELDELPKGEGEPPGELLDAGEALDFRVGLAAAALLPLQTEEQLRTETWDTNAR